MRKRHANEFMRTSFENSGRIAGMGVLYDKYDEESGGPVYGENNVRVVTPCDFLSPAERRELSGPVKTYKLRTDRPPYSSKLRTDRPPYSILSRWR